MKRIVTLCIFLCFLVIIMCSCDRKHTQPVYRAVTHVDIVTQYDDQLIRRHYSTPEKMRPVLLYLRLLKPTGNPVELDANAEDIYLISISLSDGTRHYYRQAAHRYISRESGPYKAIDPAHAAKFYSILRQLPSDV